jgi:hypothetical protein
MPVAADAIFDLPGARAILRLPPSDSGNDDLICTYINAITAVVEHLSGKQFPVTVTQTYDGGSAGILLPSNTTVVTAVVENIVTLTPPGDYTFDPRACILYRGSPLAVFSFIPGIQNVSITFTKGNATVAANIITGSELILRHFWQGTQQGNRPAFGAPDSAVGKTTNVLGYLIPNVAISFLKASPPQPGFA